MYKLIILLVFFATFVTAQTKPSSAKKTSKTQAAEQPLKDTVVVAKDTVDPVEARIKAQRIFAAYSKKTITKTGTRLRLCLQLVSSDTVLNYCINDSVCKYPEVSKILFEQTNGDTTYVLVLVDAFSKPADKPACDAGKETKLFFARWNTTTNKAIWKQRTVSSCMKAITNMTAEPIANWDKSAPLTVNFHRGGSSFVEIRFDPLQYKLGLQTVSDTDAKSEAGRE